jgi:hypothetical protein
MGVGENKVSILRGSARLLGQSLSCRTLHSASCSEPPGRFLVPALGALFPLRRQERRRPMHGLIYLIGLIVVILAILSFFGLR